MKLILVAGKAGVGKTTSSNILVDILKSRGYKVTKESFANGVKECARDYFGWDGKKDDRGRKLLQVVGTEAGRAYDKNIWARKLNDRLNDEDFVIVDDWRFYSEFDYCREQHDTITIRIESPEREILKGTEYYNHPSETELPSAYTGEGENLYQYAVYNSGDMESLKEMLSDLVSIII